jgi:hypothetical protein
MLEVIVGVTATGLLGFGGWAVSAIYMRPTRAEINRIEDKILEEMKAMEDRLMEAMRIHAAAKFRSGRG